MFKWKRAVVILTLFLLVGCENAEIKKELQRGFDRGNPSGDRGICFTVGQIDYPYTTKEITGELDERGYNRFIDRNNILNKRLAMYARLGLLSEKPTVDDKGQPTGFYQYEFTDEGLKYKGYYLNGTSQVFCFGKIVVDSIGDKQWDVKRTSANIRYYYHVEGHIPDWAKSTELNMIFRLSKGNDPIDWTDQSFNNPYRKTRDGLKPTVLPGGLVFGI